MDQEYNYDQDYGGYGEEDYNYGEQYQNNQSYPQEEEIQPEDNYSGQEYSQEPYDILPLQKIFQELNSILEEVKTVVYMDKGWCLLLLKEFKWDKDYLREEYYNKMEVYQKRIGLKPGIIPLQACQDVKDMCMVCCEQNVVLVQNVCEHAFCLQCWFGGIKSAITSGNPFMRCMDDTCGVPVLMQRAETILQLIGEEALMKRYRKKVCQFLIMQNRNYQFCTGNDCNNCIRVNEPNIQTVKCACGKIFCFKCQSDDHYPCHCQQKMKWMKQVMAQEADAKWISANAKICPKCKKAVQRSMGCNFMSCTCGQHFCYMCSKPWQPDHKDHFKCHLYKKKPDEEVSREKQVMERMNHCTERFVFNQAVANNYKQIDVFAKRRYLFKILGVQLTDSQFMQTAYKFAIECCQKLKWIYAFTYFNDMGKRKDVFEYSMGEYQKYKQNLLKLLAVDLKKFIEEVQKRNVENQLSQGSVWDLQDQFKSLKKSIVNLYTCTKNYKEKFVAELKQVTDDMQLQKQKEEMKQYMPHKTKSDDKKGGFFENILGIGKTKSKGKKAK